MTNEEIIQDLKQFIETTVSREADSIRQEVRDEVQAVRDEVHRLDVKLDDVQEAIADTLTRAMESTAPKSQVNDQEHRIRSLERRTA